MIFLRIILVTLISAIIALAVGNTIYELLSRFVKLRNSAGMRLSLGFVLSLGLGILIAGIFGTFLLPARFAFGVISIVLLGVIIYGIIARLRHGKPMIKWKANIVELKNSKKEILLFAITASLAIIQIVAMTMYSYEEPLAIKDVYVATLVSSSGVCRRGSFMMNLIGILSLAVGTHPLTFIYSILPVGMLVSYMIVYYELFMALGDSRKKSLVGVIFISLMNIWGYQSQRLILVTLLFSYFTGICFLVHGVLPLIFTILIYKYGDSLKLSSNRVIREYTADSVDDNARDDDYLEEWDMKKHKIINARNLAIALGVLALAMLAFVFVLNNKINTLHDATANLQRDLDSRCSIYEFTAEDGTDEGYLIKGTDGSLTMIGGGSISNADALYDFLDTYGLNLTNWYLYGLDEENTGAYAECVFNRGVTVENVYVLDRTSLN